LNKKFERDLSLIYYIRAAYTSSSQSVHSGGPVKKFKMFVFRPATKIVIKKACPPVDKWG